MTISLRLSDDETFLFKKYAEMKGISVSELIRQSVIERIEDECDLKDYEIAIKEFKKIQLPLLLKRSKRNLG